MKKLFLAIRQKDFELVKELIESKPELVNAKAKQPPKKDDGQSPLQVSYKTGNFKISNYLIEKGANVNYIEESEINEWRAPVIHDALRATVFSSRFIGINGMQSTKEKFEEAYNSLVKLVKAGADVNSCDSYGNTCVMRVSMDARQLPLENANKELIDDLQKIFNLLKESGAKFDRKTEDRESVLDLYKDEPVAQFFK